MRAGVGGGEGLRSSITPCTDDTVMAMGVVCLRAGANGEAGLCRLGPRRMEKKLGGLRVGTDGADGEAKGVHLGHQGHCQGFRGKAKAVR